MIRWVAGVFLAAALGVCHASPLLMFSLDSDWASEQRPVLLLPSGGQVRLSELSSRCKAGRGTALRAFDLENGACSVLPAGQLGNGHQPALEQPLSGSILAGQPVWTALEAGLLVWYNLVNRRACVVGGCNAVPSVPMDVSIDSFIASPSNIVVGESTTLAWTTTSATLCELSSSPGGPSLPVQTNGEISQSPMQTTVYTLICQGRNGPVQSELTVTVSGVLPDEIFADGFE